MISVRIDVIRKYADNYIVEDELIKSSLEEITDSKLTVESSGVSMGTPNERDISFSALPKDEVSNNDMLELVKEMKERLVEKLGSDVSLAFRIIVEV